jgi:hypothetical protein
MWCLLIVELGKEEEPARNLPKHLLRYEHARPAFAWVIDYGRADRRVHGHYQTHTLQLGY